MARMHNTLAAVRLTQGRAAEAIKLAEARAAASAGPDRPASKPARILLAAGRAPRAKELAAELDKSLSPETQALGVDAARRDPADRRRCARGDRRLQQSLKLADAWQTRYLLGRAYLVAEAFTEADCEFDACLRARAKRPRCYLDDVPTWRMMAPVYYYQRHDARGAQERRRRRGGVQDVRGTSRTAATSRTPSSPMRENAWRGNQRENLTTRWWQPPTASSPAGTRRIPTYRWPRRGGGDEPSCSHRRDVDGLNARSGDVERAEVRRPSP